MLAAGTHASQTGLSERGGLLARSVVRRTGRLIVADVKTELHTSLRASRACLLSRLEGLGEYDLRRPLTPTGTNLLGLVKHLAGLEYGYLGVSFGRDAPESLPWVDDGSIWQNADMWATPAETSAYIVGLYQRACAHADATIAALALDAHGTVAHWPQDGQDATLGELLIRMVAETAQHAGHADIVRELIDARPGPDHDDVFDDASWQAYTDGVQAAADQFRAPGPARA